MACVAGGSNFLPGRASTYTAMPSGESRPSADTLPLMSPARAALGTTNAPINAAKRNARLIIFMPCLPLKLCKRLSCAPRYSVCDLEAGIAVTQSTFGCDTRHKERSLGEERAGGIPRGGIQGGMAAAQNHAVEFRHLV